MRRYSLHIVIIGIAEATYPLLDMTLHCFTNSETCRRSGDGYDKAEMRLLKYTLYSADTNKSATNITILITALSSANARPSRRGGKTYEAPCPPPPYQNLIKPNTSNTGSAASKPIYPHNTPPTTPNAPPSPSSSSPPSTSSASCTSTPHPPTAPHTLTGYTNANTLKAAFAASRGRISGKTRGMRAMVGGIRRMSRQHIFLWQR